MEGRDGRGESRSENRPRSVSRGRSLGAQVSQNGGHHVSMEVVDSHERQNSWATKVFKAGLFRQEKKSQSDAIRVPTSSAGVSLSWLEAFSRSLSDEEDEAEAEPKTTAALMHLLVLPAISRKTGLKRRLFDYIPEECTGPPQYYVSHAWGASLKDMVLAVQEELAPTPGPAEPPLPIGFKDDIFLSIDLFAMNLYTSTQLQSTLSSTAFDSMDHDALTNIAACTKGVLLVMDRELLALNRLWILYELFLATYRSTKSHTFIRLAFPGLPPLSSITHLKEQILNLDVNKAETAFPTHKQYILQLVRKRIGLQRTNSVVNSLLIMALHNKLRWRGGLWGKGTLAALHWMEPNGSKLRHLRLLLASIDALSNDDSQLRFMKELFISYDTDGSGELDEEEFVSVLVQAGWDPSAALGAFYNVNTDGQGGVGIEEFENWWKSQAGNEDEESGSHKILAVEVTRAALKTNIERMPGLMERNELKELAQFFKSATEKMDDIWLTKPMPPIHLDSEVTRGLEEISAKVSAKDFRGACPIAYGLLYSNAQLLDVDVSSLPLPETSYKTSSEETSTAPLLRCSSSRAALAAVAAIAHMEKTYHPNLLVRFMESMAQLLRYIPALAVEQEFLIGIILELKMELDESEDAELKRSLNAKGAASIAPRDRQFGGQLTKSLMGSKMKMRETLRAKFGGKEIITEAKVKEFQFQLSQFVAATKGLTQSSRSATSSPDPTARGKIQATTAANQSALKQSQNKMEELKLPSLADFRKKQTTEQRQQRDNALEDEFGPGIIQKTSERARSFSSMSMSSRSMVARSSSRAVSRGGEGEGLGSPTAESSKPLTSKSSSQIIDDVFDLAEKAKEDIFAEKRMRIRTEHRRSSGSNATLPLVSPSPPPARESPTSSESVPGWGSLRSGKSSTRFSVAFLPDAPPIESLIKRSSSSVTEEPKRTMNHQTLARLAAFRESGRGDEEEEEEEERERLPDISRSLKKKATFSLDPDGEGETPTETKSPQKGAVSTKGVANRPRSLSGSSVITLNGKPLI